jgi:hypothetical protein
MRDANWLRALEDSPIVLCPQLSGVLIGLAELGTSFFLVSLSFSQRLFGVGRST